MDSIAVSVIIPVYNAEEYLRQCLDSVIGQTLREIEIICVDDGSTDSTPEILREYAAKVSRLRILTQENRGAGPARNAAIGIARGEYVAFMDDDDLYPEEATLSKLYRAAKENHALAYGGSFSFLNPDGSVFEGFFNEWDFGYTFARDEEMLFSDYQFEYGYHRFLYDRRFLLENQLLFPPYLRFQDPPFFVRAMITAQRFFAIHDVTYRYRLREKPLDFTSSRAKTRDCIAGLADVLELARAHELTRLYRLTLSRCFRDYWDVVSAAERFDDEESRRALQRLDQTIDLALWDPDISPVWELHYLHSRDLLTQQEHENQTLRDENRRVGQVLADVHASVSFRLGRILTWLPRMIRDGIKRLRGTD